MEYTYKKRSYADGRDGTLLVSGYSGGVDYINLPSTDIINIVSKKGTFRAPRSEFTVIETNVDGYFNRVLSISIKKMTRVATL